MLGGGGQESSIDGEERCSVVGVRRMNDDILFECSVGRW